MIFVCKKNWSSPSVNKCCSIKYLLHLQNAYILHTITPSYKCQVSIVSSLEFKQIKKHCNQQAFLILCQKFQGIGNPKTLELFVNPCKAAPLHRLEETRIPGVPWHKKTRPKSLHRLCVVHFPKKQGECKLQKSNENNLWGGGGNES